MNKVNWEIDENWIHFVSIAGKALGQLAIAYSQAGYFVTGSDPQFYDPIKSRIEKYPSIKVKQEFSFKNLIKSNYTQAESDNNVVPGKIIAGGGLSRKNKEILFATKHNLKLLNFAQDLAETVCLEKENIVIAGSFGKSTTTAALIYCFQELGINSSYMIGGLSRQFENGVKLAGTNSQYAILEGDEYFASRDDLQSKFFYYKPKYLILTGYAYDHADFFKTEADYIANFQKIVDSVPDDGLIIFNNKYEVLKQIVENKKTKAIAKSYEYDGQLMPTRLIGEFNQENLLAVKTFLTEMRLIDSEIHLGLQKIGLENILGKFSGIQRRLEVLGYGNFSQDFTQTNDNFLIINDFGSTPGKARAAINSVKKDYPESNLVCIFMPNVGSRIESSMEEYEDVFNKSNLVIVPKLKQIKQDQVLNSSEFVEKLNSIVMKDARQYDSLTDINKKIVAKFNKNKNNILLILSSEDISGILNMFKLD